MLIVHVHDSVYKEDARFRFTGERGRDDLDELDEMMERMGKHNVDKVKEYQITSSTEGA